MDKIPKTKKSSTDYQKQKTQAYEKLKELHKSDPLPPFPLEWLTEDRK